MKLTNKQDSAVQQIVDKYEIENKKIIEFQAPTGSGKTFMMLNAIDRLITTFPNEKFTFVIATLSTAELPKQLMSNLIEYKQYLFNNNEITIEYKESPSVKGNKVKDQHFQIKAKQNNILILGTQSFGKGRIFTEEGIIHSFLSEVENQDFKLVYIRDEAHIGGETSKNQYLDIDLNDDFTKQLIKIKNQEARFEFLIQQTAHFIIKTTATPKGKNDLVLLTEEDLADDNMILVKTEAFYNDGLEQMAEDKIEDQDILTKACEKFKEIKQKYLSDENLKGINPAMLIQVQDKFSKKEDEFEQRINNIIKTLNDNNLTYVKYFGSGDVESNIRLAKLSLNEISKNNSDIDVVIFKVGPATGWNIPRACMLVQLRNVSSESLTFQTLGRIKRNPNPELITNNKSIGMRYYYYYYYYYYSNVKESIKNKVTLKLREQYENYEFRSAYIDKQEVQKRIKSKTYLKDIKKILDPRTIIGQIERYKDHYKKDGFISITEQKFGSKTLLVKKIHNTIELEINKELMFSKNKTLIDDSVIKYLEFWFRENCRKIYSEFTVNLFWLIIEKQYLNDFKQKFYTSIDSNNKEVKEIYKVKYDNLPLTITNTFSELVNGVNLNDQRYGYKNIFNESNINQNYFDSKAESKFVELIRDYVLLDQGVQKNYALEMFCKNPTFKGVYIEYFDDNNNILKSYPDFIFRIKNNSTNEIIHDFYIEIKDNEDIDQNKTRLLRKAYKNYINSISSGVTENKRNMTLLILNIKILSLKMDKLPNVTCSGLSTINEINNIISEGKIYKGVEFLKDFFNISIERIIKIK